MTLDGKIFTLSLLLLFITAMAVVYAKHQSRELFLQLQALEKQRDKHNMQYGQLQLERGTWAAHARIESIAHEQLQMDAPQAQQLVIIAYE